MIKEIKHLSTGMVIKVTKVEEIRENGISVYEVLGFIKSDDLIPIDMRLLIPEVSMKDFEITYKDFSNV